MARSLSRLIHSLYGEINAASASRFGSADDIGEFTGFLLSSQRRKRNGGEGKVNEGTDRFLKVTGTWKYNRDNIIFASQPIERVESALRGCCIR